MAIAIVRGGGDLGSGVALRLYRAGIRVVVSEVETPLTVRRKVAFSEAVYEGSTKVEEVAAHKVKTPEDMFSFMHVFAKQEVPVVVDPNGMVIDLLHPLIVVDARMLKQHVALIPTEVPLIIGLGPGFIAGENCHAVIETNRGHRLGRVIWEGEAENDTGIPESVGAYQSERVLRAPAAGKLVAHAEIGDLVVKGQRVADVGGEAVLAPFDGVLRGLVHPGVQVKKGTKIGDVDPRGDPSYCSLVSDKSLAIGGAVLEAILSKPGLRSRLWE